MSEQEVAYIIGKNLASITDLLRSELGWKRINRTRWEDLEGRAVHYIRDSESLMRIPRGSMVYLLDGYDDRPDWYELDDMMTTLNCERRYL